MVMPIFQRLRGVESFAQGHTASSSETGPGSRARTLKHPLSFPGIV